MSNTSTVTSKRYVSLDVLRGLTVAFMCIVNNPGSWSHIFPPLEHAGWNGCTPTDLVYPFFLFCVGCAMAFSFSKRETVSKATYWTVIRRGLLIFLVGLLCNLYPFFPTSLHDPSASFGSNYVYWLAHKRIFGVLQRIGCSYMIAGCLALWLRRPGKIMIAMGVLMTVYTLILLIFGSDPGPFTLEGNISGKIDVALLGDNHVYHGYSNADGNAVAFDPEGPLGSLTGACTALLGYLIGSMIIRSGKRYSSDPSMIESSPIGVVSRTMVYGCLSLGLAMILSIWVPISKALWSASYVLYAGGWAMLALGFLMYWIDVRGYEKPFTVFKIMGTNALTAFVMSAVLVKTWSPLGFNQAKWFGANEYTSLLWALIFAFIIFCIQWVLYKKKIIIKL